MLTRILALLRYAPPPVEFITDAHKLRAAQALDHYKTHNNPHAAMRIFRGQTP